MIGSSYHDDGVFVLQNYASAQQVSSSTVISNIQAKYGDDFITSLGQASEGVNFSSLTAAFKKAEPTDPLSPSMADLNQALLDVGGQVSFVSAAVQGVEEAASDIGSGALSTLKYLSIVLIVVAAGYLAWQTGILNGLRKRA